MTAPLFAPMPHRESAPHKDAQEPLPQWVAARGQIADIGASSPSRPLARPGSVRPTARRRVRQLLVGRAS